MLAQLNVSVARDATGAAMYFIAQIQDITERKQRLRTTDIVGRLGGDEFAIALPEVSHEETEIMVQALQRAIARSGQPAGGQRAPLTASIGFVMFDGSLGTTDLLARADDAMYAAKRHA